MSVREAKTVIRTDGVCREYKYYKKEEGLKGSFKNLFFKKYLYKKAVDGLSVNIREGEIVGLIGLNGAGKTTTLKMLSGLLEPTSGKIDVLGYEPFRKQSGFLKQISMVMGNKNQLWWDLPAIETFRLNSKIYGIDPEVYKNRLDEMAELFQVGDLIHTQVKRLSLGERMKMEILSSLLHSPKIVFLDEPTIGLDIVSQYNIRLFLKEYNLRHHSTILLTSHNFNDIISLCNRLLILNSGKIIYDDTFENFSKKFSKQKNITIKVKNNSDFVRNFLDVSNYEADSADRNSIRFHIEDSQITDMLSFLTKSDIGDLEDIQIETIGMEEIIRNLYA